jgi:two-component sensor histidine kinase
MAAHELATNAVKYGAFRREDGRLDVSWSRNADSLDIAWRETVQNPIAPTDRKGFGTTVLESMVGRSLGAEVNRIVHPDGIEWHFVIPAAAIDPSRGPDEAQKAAQ